jgi:hypothetical protein
MSCRGCDKGEAQSRSPVTSDKRFGSTRTTVHLCPDGSQYPKGEEIVRSVATQATFCGGRSAFIVAADDDEHENGKQINELIGGSDEEHEVCTRQMEMKQVVKKDLLRWLNGKNGFAVDGVLTGHEFAVRLDRSVATAEAAVQRKEKLVSFVERWIRSDGNETQSSGPKQTHCSELLLTMQSPTSQIKVGVFMWAFPHVILQARCYQLRDVCCTGEPDSLTAGRGAEQLPGHDEASPFRQPAPGVGCPQCVRNATPHGSGPSYVGKGSRASACSAHSGAVLLFSAQGDREPLCVGPFQAGLS